MNSDISRWEHNELQHYDMILRWFDVKTKRKSINGIKKYLFQFAF